MAVQETTLDVLREAINRIQNAEPSASDHGVIQILQGVIDSHAENSDTSQTTEWQPPARVEPAEPEPPPVTTGPVRHRTNQLFKNIQKDLKNQWLEKLLDSQRPQPAQEESRDTPSEPERT